MILIELKTEQVVFIRLNVLGKKGKVAVKSNVSCHLICVQQLAASYTMSLDLPCVGHSDPFFPVTYQTRESPVRARSHTT